MLARPPSAPRWILVSILLAALAANACRFGPGGLSNPPTSTTNTVTATPAASATLPGRTAVLDDIVGTVLSGPAGSGKDVPATNGQVLSEGAQVQTGKDSKAKINLNDGTILRLRPDTLVTLDRLAGGLSNPFTRLLLAVGKVFVILKSGQLEVQSPVGVATVTGSFLSVEYQTNTNTVVVTCLEGNCTLRNNQAGVSLTTGQAASLAGGGSPVLRWMTTGEIQAWLADNPEAQAVAPAALTALPTVTGTETQTPTPSATATATPTGTATATATAKAAATATRRPRPTLTLTPTPPPTGAPTGTPTPLSTVTPTPTSGKPPQTPIPSGVPGQPLVYTFSNMCDPAAPGSPGTYHVTLTGQKSTAFDVAPQQSVQGSLPPGQYIIAWQPTTGPAEQFDYSSDQGPYSMTFCGKP